jgi:predicted RNA binding protein YcfA (HicA-like mRNA interferase family)
VFLQKRVEGFQVFRLEDGVKLADLERHLRKNGCVLAREGGRHTIWKNPSNESFRRCHGIARLKKNTARPVCKFLDIPFP